MKSKILKTIFGIPITMIGFVIIRFTSYIFAFFGWLFDNDINQEIAQDMRTIDCNPITFLKRVWSDEK